MEFASWHCLSSLETPTMTILLTTSATTMRLCSPLSSSTPRHSWPMPEAALAGRLWYGLWAGNRWIHMKQINCTLGQPSVKTYIFSALINSCCSIRDHRMKGKKLGLCWRRVLLLLLCVKRVWTWFFLSPAVSCYWTKFLAFFNSFNMGTIGLNLARRSFHFLPIVFTVHQHLNKTWWLRSLCSLEDHPMILSVASLLLAAP